MWEELSLQATPAKHCTAVNRRALTKNPSLPSLRSEVSLDNQINQMQQASTFELSVSNLCTRIPHPKDRDSKKIVETIQSWPWTCRNQTPQPSLQIRTACTGRGTSLCITPFWHVTKGYIFLSFAATWHCMSMLVPFRRQGSGLVGATMAGPFVDKSLPIQIISRYWAGHFEVVCSYLTYPWRSWDDFNWCSCCVLWPCCHGSSPWRITDKAALVLSASAQP